MSRPRHAIAPIWHRRPWSLAAVVLILAVGVVAAVLTFGRPETPDVVAAADRFRPLDGWWQVETEDRRGAGCVDVGCPRSFRRWQAPSPPSPHDLRRTIEAAGWPSPSLSGDCRPVDGRSGALPLCTAQAASDGMELTVTVTAYESYDVALTVEAR